MGGTALTAVGIGLLVAGTEDVQRLIGAVLVALGQGTLLIGVVGIGVFNGLLDINERKEAAERIRRGPDSPE